jgi:hypothetical protein
VKLELRRFDVDERCTLGLLRIDGRRACFVLEDAYHAAKISSETRIPAGVYMLALQTAGRLHAEYSKRFSVIHRGMLTLQDVPGFTGIMLHCGNTDSDTDGCLLVGDSASVIGGGRVDGSANAYVRIYPRIVAAIEAGELVGIDIVDEHG